jgi:hypothetical protein
LRQWFGLSAWIVCDNDNSWLIPRFHSRRTRLARPRPKG